MTKTRTIDNSNRPAQPEPYPSESEKPTRRDEEATRYGDRDAAERERPAEPERDQER